MAWYEVFSPPVNKLYINDVEQDIKGKKVTITRNPGRTWTRYSLNYQYSGTGIGKIFTIKKEDKIGQELSEDLLCIVDGGHIKKFNTDNMTWTNLMNAPYIAYYSGACVYDGHIHVFGGKEVPGTGYTKSVRKFHYIYEYDESTSTWKWVKLTNIPYEFYNGGVEVCSGSIHLLGGGPSKTTKTKHYAWNGSGWKARKTLPKALEGFCKTFTYDDILYAIFNYERKTNEYNMIVSRYYDVTNSWTGSNGSFVTPSGQNIDGYIDQKTSPASAYVYCYAFYKENVNDTGMLLVNLKTRNGYYNTVYTTTTEKNGNNVAVEDSNIPILTGDLPDNKGYTTQVIMYKGNWFMFIDETPIYNMAKNSTSYLLSIT